MLINVQMPTIVGIFNIYKQDISCSAELSIKKFYNQGARPDKKWIQSVCKGYLQMAVEGKELTLYSA